VYRWEGEYAEGFDIFFVVLDGELSEFDRELVIFGIFCDLDVFWFEALACSTPWGVEFDECDLILVLFEEC